MNSCTLTLLKSLVGRDIIDDSDIKLKNRIDVDRAYSRNGTYEIGWSRWDGDEIHPDSYED